MLVVSILHTSVLKQTRLASRASERVIIHWLQEYVQVFLVVAAKLLDRSHRAFSLQLFSPLSSCHPPNRHLFTYLDRQHSTHSSISTTALFGPPGPQTCGCCDSNNTRVKLAALQLRCKLHRHSNNKHTANNALRQLFCCETIVGNTQPDATTNGTLVSLTGDGSLLALPRHTQISSAHAQRSPLLAAARHHTQHTTSMAIHRCLLCSCIWCWDASPTISRWLFSRFISQQTHKTFFSANLN